MKAFAAFVLLFVSSFLLIPIEALQCRYCSTTLNGITWSGLCENQQDRGRVVLCREGYHSCNYRYSEASKYHRIQGLLAPK